MRPIYRGASPQPGDFNNYRDAFAELVARLGPYCSFCERRIATNLAVEHIQPKGLPQYAHLIGCWENFLLACVNCNSTKKDKDVTLSAVLLPDRDNTAFAFVYTPDGRIAPAPSLPPAILPHAAATLTLCGLDRGPSHTTDANGAFIAIDRHRQRMEVWAIAEESRGDLTSNPTPEMRRQVVRTAAAEGHFSVWMEVFADDAVTRRDLLKAFHGTATDCFDSGGAAVSPRPSSGLSWGSKC